MGFGPCLAINAVYVDEKKVSQNIEINWLKLFLNIVVFYAIALLITLLVGKYSRWLLAIIILILFLAFLGSTSWSKNYWGYYIRRPGLDKRVRKWEKVLTITPVTTKVQEDKSKVFVAGSRSSIHESIEDGRNDRYYCLDARVLIALEDSGKLPDSPEQMNAELLGSLYEQIDKSGLLIEGKPGNDQAKVLRGVVIEALGKDKERYVFVAVKGYPVSNDHRPYYELLFKADNQISDIRLLSRKQFFYDLAGIEGVEWWFMFLNFSGLGLLLIVPMALLIIPLVRLVRGIKESTQGPVLRHLRWGIIFSSVYFIIALSCYLIYLSNKQEYGVLMFVISYSSFPVYAICVLLQRFIANGLFFFYSQYYFLIPTVLCFTTMFYFWIGQGLAYVLGKISNQKNGLKADPSKSV
jgi:hypothetical protein